MQGPHTSLSGASPLAPVWGTQFLILQGMQSVFVTP